MIDLGIMHVARRDAQSTAGWHRIPGVDGKVEDHQIQLRSVTGCRQELGGQIDVHLHETARAALQQIAHAGDDGIYVHRPRHQVLTPCVSQQLLGELSTVRCGTHGRHNVR